MIVTLPRMSSSGGGSQCNAVAVQTIRLVPGIEIAFLGSLRANLQARLRFSAFEQ
jgi:hypothetical protein